MNRQQGFELLTEYTKSEALVRHGLCVEAAMQYYAGKLGEDVDAWGLSGLLHDFDYERFPTIPEHTREGAKILRERGCDEEIVGAIMAHVPYNLDDYPRDRPIRKYLYAVDELSGFIYAAALVRPGGFDGMKSKSIVKKLKQKAFAAAVSREDIHAGAELIEMELSDHIANCIEALGAIKTSLGFSS